MKSRRAPGRPSGAGLVAADAVVDVDDAVADLQVAEIRDERTRDLAAPGAGLRLLAVQLALRSSASPSSEAESRD